MVEEADRSMEDTLMMRIIFLSMIKEGYWVWPTLVKGILIIPNFMLLCNNLRLMIRDMLSLVELLRDIGQ